jgi:hypothetical protein
MPIMGHTTRMRTALFIVGLGALILAAGYWFAAMQ